MKACVFFRSFVVAAFATVSAACSSPFGQSAVPARGAPGAKALAHANDTTRHLYVIVTTSTRFVAEYPIRNGIPRAKPDRTVLGLFAPNALTVDGTGHLYVLDYKTIKEFAPGASGYARPIRTIFVPNFLNINTLAVDPRGYLYVGQAGHVYVYAPGARGRAKPIARIKPVGYPAGLTTDAADDLYAQGNTEEMNPYRIVQTHASVYSAAPKLQRLREFCSYEMTASGIDYGVALDGHSRLFTTHTYFVGSYPSGAIHVFPANANRCPMRPSAKITTNPTLHEPVYLAVDSPYLYVGDVFYGNGGVVFTLRTTGSPQKPLSTLNVADGQPHNIFGIALGP